MMILSLLLLVLGAEGVIEPYLRVDDFLDHYTRDTILEVAEDECPPVPEEGTRQHERQRATERIVDLTLPPHAYHLVQETMGRVSWELRQFFHVERDIFPFWVTLSRWYPGTRFGLHSDVAYNPGSTWELKGTPYRNPGRSHACMVYLNDDFEGGQLYFQEDFHDASLGQEVVHPREGMLLCFPSTPEGWHGVQEILEGTRFVLSSWFTEELGHSFWMHNVTQDKIRSHDHFIRSLLGGRAP